MRAPRKERLALRIILGEIVLGNPNGQSLVKVPPVFLRKSVATVLKVPGNVNLMEVSRGEKCRAGVKPLGKHGELRMLGELSRINGSVPGMRHVVHFIEAVGQKRVFIAETLRKDAKELRAQLFLRDAVKIIQTRERAPAEVHR